jgi:hypothetical protein
MSTPPQSASAPSMRSLHTSHPALLPLAAGTLFASSYHDWKAAVGLQRRALDERVASLASSAFKVSAGTVCTCLALKRALWH